MVQILSTTSDRTYSANLTNGSWWIVQILSSDTLNSLICAGFSVREK